MTQGVNELYVLIPWRDWVDGKLVDGVAKRAVSKELEDKLRGLGASLVIETQSQVPPKFGKKE